MKEINRKAQGIHTYGQQLFMTLGIVKNNADPAHHGRLQIFCPNIDAEDYEVENLPWAWYIAPFGGTTANFKVGREQTAITGVTAYGMWAIPKNGAQVLVGFLDGNAENRFYLGALMIPEQNRTLPAGIDGIKSEIDETGFYPQTPFETYKKNQSEAGLYEGSQHFKTRGSYERSVSHPSNKNKTKPTDNGYYPKPLEPNKADSQLCSWTTPGKHYILMSDVDEYCRMRFRTTEGNQIILDDTNERIYISTAKGRNWIEIDEGSGKIYFYTASKFSVHSENDLNLYSSENINIVAKKRINIQSEERAVKIQAKRNVEMTSTDANVKVTASRDMYLKTTNGPKADKIPEKSGCNSPPYSGQPLGFWRDYEEEAGSPTSKVFINSNEGMDIRSDNDIVKLTAKKDVEIRAISGNIKLAASERLDFKATGTGIYLEGPKINIKSAETLSLTAGTDMNLKSTTELKAQAGTHMSLSAASNLMAQAGSSANVSGGLTANIQGGVINLNASEVLAPDINPGPGPALPAQPAQSAEGAQTATPAEQAKQVEPDKIKPKMIVPKHESWTRDEDEGNCKTPRNSKYQG